MVADVAARLSSVAGRISAGSEMAFRRGFRSDGARRPESFAAPGKGQEGDKELTEPRRSLTEPHAALHTPESSNRSGYDGAKRKRSSKVHAAVDTLGHLLALQHVTPTSEHDREQVEKLAEAIREATGDSV